jgi:DNA helicase II / ATP-dependent DNA helicase PcrA
MPAVRTRPSLSPQQIAAVEHVHGPMLVRAGAGTGKTTVMVERIYRLVEERVARPEQIAAVTFTLEAAAEIRKRVQDALGKPGEKVVIGTFHQLAFDIVCRNGGSFEVLEDFDLWVALRMLIDERRLPLRYFLRASNPGKFLGDFVKFFVRCTEALVDARRYREYVRSLADPAVSLPRVHSKKEDATIRREDVIARCEEIADVFEVTEHFLRSNGLGTFGMMMFDAVRLLEREAQVLAAERERIHHLLIDEFQDCNSAQIAFARLLTGHGERNVFAVGDPDQAIYRFRGASSAAFEEFLEIFSEAKAVTLAENQRSTSTILTCAHAIISQNPDAVSADYRRAKLISAREQREPLQPAPVEIVIARTDDKGPAEAHAREAYDVVKTIQERKRADRRLRWRDFAVIYRQHNHSALLIDELADKGVPFVVVGTDVLNVATVRDLIAILRALDTTDDISLFRLAIRPSSGIDLHWLHGRLSTVSRGTPIVNILESNPSGRALLDQLRAFRDKFDLARLPAVKVIAAAIRAFGITAPLDVLQRFTDFVEKWQRLPITPASTIASLLKYLDYFAQAGGEIKLVDAGNTNAVRLMTAHSAKGLEFEHVFVIRVASPSFPTGHREPLFEFPSALGAGGNRPSDDPKDLHDQEERRLFYVAMTRARNSLALYAKEARGKEIVPTTYLRDLTSDRTLRSLYNRREADKLIFDLAANAPSVVEKAAWLRVSYPTETPRALSASGIETYNTCPLKYRLRTEWKLSGEPSAALQFGAAMHRVLHEYHRARIAGNASAKDEVIAMFKRELAGSRMADPVQHELYERQGIAQLERFLVRTDHPAPASVVANEQSFLVQIDGVDVTGRIDRIDRLSSTGEVMIVDYKTGVPKSEEDAEESLQLSLYGIAAREQWGHTPVRLAFHNLEDDSIVSIAPDPGQAKKTRAAVVKVAQGIAEKKFEPKPGFWCGFCEYHTICPATEEELYNLPTKAAASKS